MHIRKKNCAYTATGWKRNQHWTGYSADARPVGDSKP